MPSSLILKDEAGTLRSMLYLSHDGTATAARSEDYVWSVPLGSQQMMGLRLDMFVSAKQLSFLNLSLCFHGADCLLSPPFVR